MKSSLIYAHRGAHSEFLENTSGAFDRAIEVGVDGIETDVQISKDGVSVLWHDSHLGKIGRPNSRIGELDSEELSHLELSAFGPGVDAESGLVSLDRFILDFGGSCNLLLEVKNLDWDRNTGRHQRNIHQCLEAAKKFVGQGPDSGVLVSSFDLESLLYAHVREPLQALVLNINTGFRIDDIQQSLNENPFFQGYCFPIDDLDVQVCRLMADHGKLVLVFTCNTDAQIEKALGLDVDILISDFPLKALEFRNNGIAQ